MIERLARALEHIDELSPDAQEDIAEQIEEMTHPPEVMLDMPPAAPGYEHLPKRTRDALAVFGIARDLGDEDEFEALDRIRHSSPPSPPPDLDDL